MRLLLPLVLVGFLLLFVVSVVAPRKSKRLQAWVDERLEQGQQKGHRSGGRFGNWTARMLALAERAADRTSQAGRRLRDRVRR